MSGTLVTQRPIVIVGGGHSGAKASAALRKHGWSGPITLIGDECHLPYDRPPLSKAVLLGSKTADQCAFFPENWYFEKGIDLLLGRPVARIERDDSRVLLGNGHELRYHRLLLATGSSLNTLPVPGADLDGVWPLRTPAHANAIAGALRPGARVVVIGAGVIGLEVAAAAVERGSAVHVLEMAPIAMARNLPQIVSAALVEAHRRRGVEIRFGARVAALEGEHKVSCVRLESGESLDCDAVVYGVGVKPRTELAKHVGLHVDDGIITDSFLQTNDKNIFACGDVCRYDSRLFGRHLRIENWRNAEDQADAAARNILGQQRPFDPVPWFWSNQYDLTLQVAGLPALGSLTVTREVGASRLLLSVGKEGRLWGVSGLGSVRDIAAPIRQLKDAIAAEHVIDVSKLDEAVASASATGLP